jgi:mercuric ion binding protein
MKRRLMIAALSAVVGLSSLAAIGIGRTVLVGNAIAQAAEATQTLVFAVENMTCPLCPVTVRTAMEQVSGVKSVTVDFDAKTATVVFDPAQATPEGIAKASADAGYPAHPAS